MRSATPCPSRRRSRLRVVALTILALTAFAANSVLCRAALGEGTIDAASFSALRLLSGALTLWVLVTLRPARTTLGGSWPSATALFLYAVPFSFAYESLAAGTGALILFGAVQATMLIAAVLSGERPSSLQWLGLLIALGGLVYLVLPGVSAPDPLGSALMTVAGISWGFYSLRGRAATDPLGETAGNFARSLPMVALVSAASLGVLRVETTGAILAVTSGALASGVGYAIWYAALPALTAARAATVQLSVPVLAAMGGVIFMAEAVTPRLGIASVLILGGVALALLKRRSV
jgi:drug/metabolite transporter (DMT)-like permease